MSDNDVVALIAAHVEGDLDPVSRSHLAGLISDDKKLETAMSEQVRTHLLLHAVLNYGQPNAAVQRARLIPASFNPHKKKQLIASAQAFRPVHVNSKSSRWWLVMTMSTATAASILTAIVVTLFNDAASTPTHITVAAQPAAIVADDDVRVVRGTGLNPVSPASSASSGRGLLLPGDTIMTGTNQRASLVYSGETTRFSLGPHTRLQALHGSGKRFRLEQGMVAVDAAPQSTQSPLIVQTPQADVTVVGTAFDLTSDNYLTWLSVDHGSVQLKDHDGKELLVTGGQRALAASGLSLIPSNRGCGLIGAYYQGKDFTDLKVKRLDSTINFDWETDEPVPGMSHPFSVRWTGMIAARFAETYRIYLPSDDGVRLWIDDRLVYDNWRVQGYKDSDRRYGTFTFSPERLRVPIRIEYYENYTFAIIRMSWMSPSQPRQLVPASAFYPEGL